MTSPRARLALLLALGAALGLGAGHASPARAQLAADVAGDAGVLAHAVKDGGAIFADLDGDGWPELVVNANGRGFLFANGGDGTFTDVTSTRAPAMMRSGVERSVVAADMNNDGYLDLLRTGQNYMHVLLNRGPDSDPPYLLGGSDGTPDFFTDGGSDPDLDAYEGLGVLDIDRDGYLDFVLENDAELRVYANQRDGATYTIITAAGLLPNNTTDNGDYIALTDWDVDGFVDIATRNSNAVLGDLFHANGDGTFTSIPYDTIQSPNSARGSIAFCDVDNDGDFDFFYTSGTGAGINHVWTQNDGVSFVDSGQPDVGSGSVDGVACGDLDNDGDVDLYLSRSGTDYVYLNQLTESGMVVWTRAMTTTAAEDGEGVVMCDFDRDGDLDVYVNQWGGTTTDPMTMVTTDLPADNALLRNDTGGTSYLAIEVLTEVASCPEFLLYRPDVGAVVRVALGDTWTSGVHEINGGEGHGSQGPPYAHIGLPMGPDETYVVTIRFQNGDEPDARIRVTPSSLGGYQLLTVRSSDPDGDGILTSIEIAQAAMFGGDDLDGDGFPAWYDDDSDGDGVSDAIEAGDTDPCTDPVDADSSGTPDYLEVPPSGDGGPGVDGGVGPGVDGGVGPGVDGGGGGSQLQAHGSGCARCAIAAGSERSAATPGLVAAIVAAAALARASRRRR